MTATGTANNLRAFNNSPSWNTIIGELLSTDWRAAGVGSSQPGSGMNPVGLSRVGVKGWG